MSQTTQTHSPRKVLIIGGHGKVALLATPKLVARGDRVTSVIRAEEQAGDVEKLGATAHVADITALSAAQWRELVSGHDVIVWSAGAGGKGGAEATYAVDRDAALSLVGALEELGADAPRLILVSYAGSLHNPWGEGHGMHAYGEAKQAVDERLAARVAFDHLVLAPGVLTLEPDRGIRAIPDEAGAAAETSRELVADVIVEAAGRAEFPHAARFAFVDGDEPVTAADFGA